MYCKVDSHHTILRAIVNGGFIFKDSRTWPPISVQLDPTRLCEGTTELVTLVEELVVPPFRPFLGNSTSGHLVLRSATTLVRDLTQK